MTISTATTEERSLLAALPVEQKVRLLTGADSWRTHGADALGLRPMIMSDGPAGVRGITMDERKPAGSLPCPSALGATWDSELVYELGTALGTGGHLTALRRTAVGPYTVAMAHTLNDLENRDQDQGESPERLGLTPAPQAPRDAPPAASDAGAGTNL